MKDRLGYGWAREMGKPKIVRAVPVGRSAPGRASQVSPLGERQLPELSVGQTMGGGVDGDTPKVANAAHRRGQDDDLRCQSHPSRTIPSRWNFLMLHNEQREIRTLFIKQF